jgi:hypothetical protein
MKPRTRMMRPTLASISGLPSLFSLFAPVKELKRGYPQIRPAFHVAIMGIPSPAPVYHWRILFVHRPCRSHPGCPMNVYCSPLNHPGSTPLVHSIGRYVPDSALNDPWTSRHIHGWGLNHQGQVLKAQRTIRNDPATPTDAQATLLKHTDTQGGGSEAETKSPLTRIARINTDFEAIYLATSS